MKGDAAKFALHRKICEFCGTPFTIWRERMKCMGEKRKGGGNQIAIVTGASSGLGREFIRQIAARYPGLDEIWAVARRRERLEELKESYPNICPVCADLLTVSGRDLLRKKLETEQPGVRLLVLGAGCGHYGLLETQKEEALAEMIALNDEALTRVLAMALPHIPEKSRILAIASSAAYLPQPGFAVYAATKAYVRHLCLALGQELKKRRVTVTAVCPGPVKTEFFQRAGQTIAPWKQRFLNEPAPVVEKALKDADRGRAESVYGISMKAVRIGAKCLPWNPLIRIMGKFAEERRTKR